MKLWERVVLVVELQLSPIKVEVFKQNDVSCVFNYNDYLQRAKAKDRSCVNIFLYWTDIHKRNSKCLFYIVRPSQEIDSSFLIKKKQSSDYSAEIGKKKIHREKRGKILKNNLSRKQKEICQINKSYEQALLLAVTQHHTQCRMCRDEMKMKF
ncbi:CLUMA_CG002709, isoform A [Clunio marinus]|uniref:CLUMA_CG002709, isoform A n=1 Tax=Clunio marinus TaxID=568069 RepID=A0A1J1HLU5_9DIPT|nr:CLUMA_CG002709, isoform A [Clunio marinus]